MKKLLFAFILITSNLFSEAWIPWDSPEGLTRMESCQSKANFWKLLRYYESQIMPTGCSIASSVIALNALAVIPPKSKQFEKYPMFTQENFLTIEFSEIVSPIDVIERGMSQKELAEVLRLLPISVTMHEALSLSEDEIRSLLVAALENPNQCVLALFQRKVLNQKGGGHWSPVAAYDAASDSFLILDVARFKYPPFWVNATDLIHAMQTHNLYGQSRGFLILDSSALSL